MTSKACTREEIRRCKAELYEVMPGLSAAESLRLLEADRRDLIPQIIARITHNDSGWVFLFNMARAVTALRIWIMLQAAAGNVACFETKYLKLRDWVYRLWTQYGHVSDFQSAVDEWGANLVGASIVEIRNVTSANLADGVRRRIQRVWVSIMQAEKMAYRSSDDQYEFWARRLNNLPAELLAVLLYWTKQPV
jgi:hypothetical protein